MSANKAEVSPAQCCYYIVAQTHHDSICRIQINEVLETLLSFANQVAHSYVKSLCTKL